MLESHEYIIKKGTVYGNSTDFVHKMAQDDINKTVGLTYVSASTTTGSFTDVNNAIKQINTNLSYIKILAGNTKGTLTNVVMQSIDNFNRQVEKQFSQLDSDFKEINKRLNLIETTQKKLETALTNMQKNGKI